MCNLSQSIRERAFGEGHIKGLMEGRMEGRMEGLMEGRMEVAKKLIALGTMTLESIAEVSKLPLAKVKELSSVKTV